MPRGKWIDKKNASHFTLVYRPQNDPLIHDENAPAMVLNPTPLPNSSKIKKLDDLASELGSEVDAIRENEGEAANYGIYYDDTEYDYMQHLREIGTGGGAAYFVEAKAPLKKGKEKQSLEDALKNVSLDEKESPILGAEMLPSKNLTKASYQTQQDIPDEIAGLNPDMDPRLREVLEALDDEAYVDDDDNLFQELAEDGEEIDQYEFEDVGYDEDEGWESDDTAKPVKEYKNGDELNAGAEDGEKSEPSNEDWVQEFNKYKRDQKMTKKTPVAPSQSDLQSSIMTTTTNGGRHKKRKGALTSKSGYSMTSSSLFRTEGLTILDARFDKIEEDYNEAGDDMSSVSGISTASSVTGPMRSDFDSIMDDFLGSYSMSGKKRVKKGKYQTGLDQLDEIRKGLGPPKVRS